MKFLILATLATLSLAAMTPRYAEEGGPCGPRLACNPKSSYELFCYQKRCMLKQAGPSEVCDKKSNNPLEARPCHHALFCKKDSPSANGGICKFKPSNTIGKRCMYPGKGDDALGCEAGLACSGENGGVCIKYHPVEGEHCAVATSELEWERRDCAPFNGLLECDIKGPLDQGGICIKHK